MTRLVRVENGVVKEVVVADGVNWFEAPDEVEVGYAYDGSFKTPINVEESQQAKLANAPLDEIKEAQSKDYNEKLAKDIKKQEEERKKNEGKLVTETKAQDDGLASVANAQSVAKAAEDTTSTTNSTGSSEVGLQESNRMVTTADVGSATGKGDLVEAEKNATTDPFADIKK